MDTPKSVTPLREKPALQKFAYLGYDIGILLQNLKSLAMAEEWEYLNTPNYKPLPILYNYLFHTFTRVQEEGKIIEKNGLASFNTGLITTNQQEIFMLFKKTIKGYSYLQFCNESDNILSKFNPLPERAKYFDDPSDLSFDPRLDLRVNIDHIIDDPLNFERFPADIQALPKHQLINTFNGAIEHAKKRIRRNYKTAIPQYFRGKYIPKGQLQLLLPLCLRDHTKADLALAVYKSDGFYSGRTCLTLDMAINNARLIAKPDDEWLKA